MRCACFVLLALALLAPAGSRASTSDDLTHFVDPFIGTLGAGFTYPGAAAPYGMVQNSPDTEGEFAYTGYQWMDHEIRGFSLVHTEAMGVQEGGQIPIMPTTGAVQTDVARYESPFLHAQETATAGYYSVRLLKYGIDAELTAGTRIAMQRFTFPATTNANVLIDVGRQVSGGHSFPTIPDNDPAHAGETTPGENKAHAQIVDGRTIIGTANGDRAADDGFPVHFAARFSRPFVASGVWASRGSTPTHAAVVDGKGAGAYATFDTSKDRVVTVTIGVSFTSEANALANLDAEAPGNTYSFDHLRDKTRAAWNHSLHAIEVPAGNPADLTSFYTALYHVQLHPNVFEDASGDYLGYDHAVHRVGAPGDAMPRGSTYYANYSLWDTYRAEMPLLELIAPDSVRDMMRSLAAIVIQGGRIPRWGWMDRYADFMNGEPGINVVSDAYCRGLVPADAMSILYANMRALALDPSHHRDPAYLDKGYVPLDGSATLEFAIGDFALANVANALGRTADRDALLNLAADWRNVFDPSTRFMRPRKADGSWYATRSIPGVGGIYAPEMPDHWKEGTGWQYSWLVPQDIRGLFNAMGAGKGGDSFVQERLDQFFSEAHVAPGIGPDLQQKESLFGIAYYGDQYTPANETDLEAPWEYDWIGQPWKGQNFQRNVQELYRPTPDGLPGNDDLGTMSAWLVWSDLGIYPTTPGALIYATGSPLFERATIRTSGAPIVVTARGASIVSKYIGSLSVNGSPITHPWVTQKALSPGSTIAFDMSPIPNVAWGTARADAPPSMSTASSLQAFGCSR
jgi:predicted alpha-1,2-mannosidase